MKVGYLQYDVKHSCEENFEIIEKYLEKADCDIVLLPELSLCGYLFKSREELEKAA